MERAKKILAGAGVIAAMVIIPVGAMWFVRGILDYDVLPYRFPEYGRAAKDKMIYGTGIFAFGILLWNLNRK